MQRTKWDRARSEDAEQQVWEEDGQHPCLVRQFLMNCDNWRKEGKQDQETSERVITVIKMKNKSFGERMTIAAK